MTGGAAVKTGSTSSGSIDAAVAGLPFELAEVVRQVVNRTRLWKSEKVEVALELAEHFRDGLESGASAQALRDAFGDPVDTARLIRRAKKRQRPIVWRAVRRTAQGVGALLCFLLLVIGFFLGRSFMGRPTVSVDYLAVLNAQADGHRQDQVAWPRLREVLFELRPAFTTEAFFTAETVDAPGSHEWPATRAWLENKRPQLAAARHALSRPHFGFVARHKLVAEDARLWGDNDQAPLGDPEGLWQQSLYAVRLPYLNDMRPLAKALAADMWLAADTGDANRVIENVEAILALNRHVREIPVLINDLVGVTLFRIGQERLFQVLERYPDLFDGQQLALLAHQFAAIGDDQLRARPQSERVIFYDAVQRMYTDDGGGDGYLTSDGREFFGTLVNSGSTTHSVSSIAADLAVPLVTMNRHDLVREFDRCMDLMALRARTPLWDLHATESVDNQLSAWMSSPWMRARLLPLVTLMPAVERAGVIGQMAIFRRDVTVALLAVMAFRHEEGRYPDSLQELTPRFLPTIPRDAFGGAPIGYHLAGDKPVLYSIGADYDDDGGRPHLTDANRIDQRPAMNWRPRGDARIATPKGIRNHSEMVDGDWILYPHIVEEITLPTGPPVLINPW